MMLAVSSTALYLYLPGAADVALYLQCAGNDERVAADAHAQCSVLFRFSGAQGRCRGYMAMIIMCWCLENPQPRHVTCHGSPVVLQQDSMM